MPPQPDRSINGYSVYKLYLMLKNHFNGRYDVIKYRWSMKVSTKSYHKRKDKYFYERLSQQYTLRELVGIFTSNLVANSNAWVGEMSDSDAILFYRHYMGRLNKSKYYFREQLESLVYYCHKKDIIFKELFDCSQGQPIIFKMLQQDVISYETFILINSAGRFIHKLDTLDDVIWDEYKSRINAYTNLLDINSTDAKSILIDVLKSSD